jgi:acyl carrier protein
MKNETAEKDARTSARFEKLDYAERWMRNGLEVLDAPGFFIAAEADMTQSRLFLDELHRRGVQASYACLFIRATALALARNPDLHQLVSGSRRCRPAHVNIALSVAGDSFLAPILPLGAAEQKSTAEIAAEVAVGMPRVRAEQQRMFARIRGWGRLIPFAFLRRMLLRLLLKRLLFARPEGPTFQVTCLPDVELLAPFLFTTAGILGVGRVRERVVAEAGRPAVRLGVTLTVCADHRVWDGLRAARFLNEVKQVLESGELFAELPPPVACGRSENRTIALNASSRFFTKVTSVLEAELRHHIRTELAPAAVGMEGGDDFLDAVLLDSMARVQLLLHIEQTYGVRISDQEAGPEHFSSVTALARFIEAKQRRPIAEPVAVG